MNSKLYWWFAGGHSHCLYTSSTLFSDDEGAVPFVPLFNVFIKEGFPGGLEVKSSAHNAGDLGSIPGLGRFPGEGNGNPVQYSCLENPMGGRTWRATVYGVAKSWT